MKKIFIAVTLVISTGIFISCTQEVTPQPVLTFEHSTTPFRKDIGTAD